MNNMFISSREAEDEYLTRVRSMSVKYVFFCLTRLNKPVIHQETANTLFITFFHYIKFELRP